MLYIILSNLETYDLIKMCNVNNLFNKFITIDMKINSIKNPCEMFKKLINEDKYKY